MKHGGLSRRESQSAGAQGCDEDEDRVGGVHGWFSIIKDVKNCGIDDLFSRIWCLRSELVRYLASRYVLSRLMWQRCNLGEVSLYKKAQRPAMERDFRLIISQQRDDF